MSISRILNRTPIQNDRSNIYETNINDDLFKTILSSRFVGEGVFAIEQFSMSDYIEQYLVTPSFDKYNYTDTSKEWQFDNDEIVYELVLEKPYFLPLDIKQHLNLFKFISQIDTNVFIQVLLCRRLDQWRDAAIDCYYSYLDGNDNPISNKTIRSIQSKVINVLNKVSNYNVKRNEIEEIEQKILQNNYRFECRIVLFEPKNHQKFEEIIKKEFKNLNLFNEMVLKRVKNKKNLLNDIKNRSFQVEYVNQMLSEKEVASLLAEGELTTSTYTPTVAPVKRNGVTQRIEESQLLQRAIQLLPYTEKKSVEIDQSIVQQINQAFKRVGIVQKPLKVSEIHQGATLLKVEMIIPPDITYTSITKKLTDIKSALGNEGVSVEISSKPDAINVYVPLEQRGVVYFRNILESNEFQEFKQKYPLPFILGENANGELMFADLSDLPHLLVAGATKSGKSVFVNLLLLCLILSVNPNELSLYLVDPKQVEYSMFNGFPQVKQVITDMKKADGLLESLVNEMENRYEIFAKSGVKNIVSYNKNNEQKMSYIVVSVDEYADLVMVNPNVEEYLVRLGQKARACGIHLIICTQKPLSNIVTSVLKSNLPSTISFRLKTSADYMTVFGKGIPFNLLGKGDGVCKLESQSKEYERFQSAIMTLDEELEDAIYSSLKELFKDTIIESVELPEVVKLEPIDELKRIIASTNELRVSELGRLMGIGNNKVHSLIQELLEKGWLGKEGRSYVVAVDENELNKWKE